MANFEFNKDGKSIKNSATGLVGKVGGFFRRHKTKIVIGATVVVVAGVAYYVYTNHRGERITVEMPDHNVDGGDSTDTTNS